MFMIYSLSVEQVNDIIKVYLQKESMIQKRFFKRQIWLGKEKTHKICLIKKKEELLPRKKINRGQYFK